VTRSWWGPRCRGFRVSAMRTSSLGARMPRAGRKV
jgi:hypothetical protein